MKHLFLILLLSLLFTMPASAKVYKWIDDDGVFHIVDDLHKVPVKDRDKLGLDLEAQRKEIRAPEKSIIKPAPQIFESSQNASERRGPTDPSSVLYGGKTLEWWVKTFSRLQREKSELEQSIASKEEYNSVFEGGRRLGTIYTQESVDSYNSNIEKIAEDKDKLEKKKEYIEKLQRKAKNAGVPRNVRGE